MPIPEGYRTESPDTSPEAEQVMIEIARRRTPGEKAARVWALMEYVHNLAFTAMKKQRPELSDDDIRARLTSRRIGRDLFIKAFGWDPEADGR